ncbi:ATP-binding cassette domain-containing protein [Brachybacterium sp. JB7]|uniref:methionine ABC transporter ATP-binding protein n=1 Tax=Brachybacterium TaxID=43668 RepID=UPI000DF13E14|nr:MULTISPECIES: ATP-binding cassette domain-containing protein [Brachybacterium]RCS60300.1 ATP-binding cassette domain-containing protein [Brachybacterium sp. JB7]RCS66813.1 ATP-binding cassette domain-containing protein [Brachybacterium alimentarium]
MIQFRHVTKTFPQGRSTVTALEDIDLTIAENEMVGIVGASGSGKSTLLRLINHLEAPTSGTVLVDGEDLSTLPARAQRERRRGIGMVFQQFNLLANSTVLDNVLMPLRLQGGRGAARRETALQMLDFVRMADHRDKHPARLSGGEKQRVAIARALVTRPRILLADEPTSALDSGHSDDVMAVLREVRTEFRTTIVLVSHALDVVKSSCDRAAVLEHGRLAALTDVTPPPPREQGGSYAERATEFLA